MLSGMMCFWLNFSPWEAASTVRERGGHCIKVDVVRNDVLLVELLPVGGGLHGQLLTVELDGDVLRAVLLHVEGELVLITLLHLQQDGGLGRLAGGGRDVVLGLLDLVVHLRRGRRHGRGGHRVLWLGLRSSTTTS